MGSTFILDGPKKRRNEGAEAGTCLHLCKKAFAPLNFVKLRIPPLIENI